MRHPWPLLVAFLLLSSGCASPPDPAPSPTSPAFDEDDFDPVTFYDETIEYDHDGPDPAPSLVINNNTTTLHFSAFLIAHPPCGFLREDEQGNVPAAEFESPNGTYVLLEFGAQTQVSCGVNQSTNGFADEKRRVRPDLGTWRVTLSGIGVSASVQLRVVQEPPEGPGEKS